MWSRTWQNCKKGFTLIEILVSVALISVIMLLIWQTTSQSIGAKKRIEKREELYHFARVAMNKMMQDVSMAFLLKGHIHSGLSQGSPKVKTLFKGEAERLQLASLSHLRLFQNTREAESAQITYQLERDPESRDLYLLMRRESKGIDADAQEEGFWVPLAGKVKRLEFSYYDGTKFDWKTSWDSEAVEKEQLPRAVKITLALEHPSHREEEIPFTTMVLVGMYKNAIEF